MAKSYVKLTWEEFEELKSYETQLLEILEQLDDVRDRSEVYKPFIRKVSDMIEQKFTNCQGEQFIIEFDGDRVVEVYSKSHDVLAEITEAGLGQYLAIWPNAIHPDMRVIPCLGRDGWPYWIVQEFTTGAIILDR